MDHLSTPGSAPATFASHPLASVTPLASGADAGHETSTKANYQDALLFIAPPLLSAAVLGALSVNLHRIPSAHPLADASLLCAGAAAILITAWWFISFIYALFYAWSLRVSSHNADRAVLKVPAIFRPRFMRRIVLTLGGTALGVGAVLAPAQATVVTPSNAGLTSTEGMPQTTISAVMTAESTSTVGGRHQLRYGFLRYRPGTVRRSPAALRRGSRYPPGSSTHGGGGLSAGSQPVLLPSPH